MLAGVHAAARALFWVAAIVAGLSMGSSQSAGRAMVGVLAPPAQLAEFFGLWSFATRLAAIVGPADLRLRHLGHRRQPPPGHPVTALFFVAGILLLLPIDMKRGRAAALAAS